MHYQVHLCGSFLSTGKFVCMKMCENSKEATEIVSTQCCSLSSPKAPFIFFICLIETCKINFRSTVYDVVLALMFKIAAAIQVCIMQY